MIVCSDCNHHNIEGMFYCDECGNPLLGEDILKIAQPSSTQQLESVQISENAAPDSTIPLVGTSMLGTDTVIIMHFSEQNERVSLQPQSEIVLGRIDQNTHTYPDIDLTPHGALEHGVSRTHATIRRAEDSMTVMDMDSANGTYLNGKKLIPHQPHILRDGDEIKFGKLTSRIYFK